MRLPIQLNPLHRFVDKSQYFICDLTTGAVVEVDPVFWEIIEACRTLSQPALLNRFEAEFPEHQIFAALEKIEEFAQAGIIVSGEVPQTFKTQRQRLNVLVFHDLLSTGSDPSAFKKVRRYATFLPLLKDVVDLCFPSPQLFREAFQGLESHATIQNWDPRQLYRELRRLHGTYDLILDLACESGLTLPLYNQETPPIVTLNPEHAVPSRNHLLAKAAMMRPFDAIILENSWQNEWIRNALPGWGRLATAASGIVPPDDVVGQTSQAREQILQFVGRDFWKEKPIVGLFVAGKVGQVLRTAFDLAVSTPEFNFLLLGVSRPTTTKSCPENLYSVGIHSLPDAPMWWQGLSLLCVVPGWTISLSYLLVAMAHETPLVICSETMPPEFENACFWIPCNRGAELSTLREKFLPVAHQILEAPEEDERLKNLGKCKAAEFTPQIWVSKLAQIFQESVEHYQSTSRDDFVELPLLFCRSYDPTTTRDRTEAIVLSDSSRLTLKEGLFEALAPECTPVERNILERVLSQKSQTDKREP